MQRYFYVKCVATRSIIHFFNQTIKKVRSVKNAPKKCRPSLLSHNSITRERIQKREKHLLPSIVSHAVLIFIELCDKNILPQHISFVNDKHIKIMHHENFSWCTIKKLFIHSFLNCNCNCNSHTNHWVVTCAD